MADQTQNDISQATKNRLEGVHQIEEKKQEILQIAEKLFLAHGIEKTPMTEIAREAGITKATLYRYFPNREEIAVQILIVMLERMMDVLGVDHRHHERRDPAVDDLVVTGLIAIGLLRPLETVGQGERVHQDIDKFRFFPGRRHRRPG